MENWPTWALVVWSGANLAIAVFGAYALFRIFRRKP